MKLSRIKHYIKQIMPFRMVLKYEEKHDFATDYFAWKAKNSQVQFDEESKWESIVSVTGFGYSGSGAVVDLLREYDDCLVHGMAEGGSKAVIADDDLGEVYFIWNVGGLMDIDIAVDSPLMYMGDEVLNRFAKMIYRDPLYHRQPQYREYIYKFFDSMVEDVHSMNGTLSPIFFPKIKSYVYTMHEYTKEEYYALCRKFINSIFNVQKRGNERILVLDQVLGAFKEHFDYTKNFLPHGKQIVVYRDPRDIYAIAMRQNIEWITHDTVEHFIQSMRQRYTHLHIDSKDYLVIRFEDLILDYEKTVAQIEKYLNLGEHKRPMSCLDTSISCKNIGMWKNAEDIPQSDFDKIYEELMEYCYTK